MKKLNNILNGIKYSGKIDEKDYNNATDDADYMFKRQAYFHVKEINNNDEYNGILISVKRSFKTGL